MIKNAILNFLIFIFSRTSLKRKVLLSMLGFLTIYSLPAESINNKQNLVTYTYVVGYGTQTIYSCIANPSLGKLTCKDSGFLHDLNPLYIAINPDGTNAYIGTTTNVIGQCHIVLTTGLFSDCKYTIIQKNATKGVQGITINNSGTYAYFSAIGSSIDSPTVIYKCKINPTTGELSDCQDSGALLTNARQIMFDKADAYAYITTYTNSISQCQVNSATGVLSNCKDSGATGIKNPVSIYSNSQGTFAYIGTFSDIYLCAIKASNQGGGLYDCKYAGGPSSNGGPILGIALMNTDSYLYFSNYFIYGSLTECTVNSSTGLLSNCGTVVGPNFNRPAGVALHTYSNK